MKVVGAPAMQRVLVSERLELRPASADDLDALWALWTHPDVRRFLWDDRVIDRHEAAAVLEDCLGRAPGGLGMWTLRARGPRSGDPLDAERAAPLLGCAALLPVTVAAAYEPRLAGLVEPLIALSPVAWGHGHATEALRALVTHAHTDLALPRLAAVTDVPNVASDRMLRRADFQVLSECDGPRYRLRTYLHEAEA